MFKSKSLLFVFLLAFLAMQFLSSCSRIDAGHVGIKVNLYGDTAKV